ncbi:MAG: hypothetical protein ABIO18_13570 [Croceibacterium sp.]
MIAHVGPNLPQELLRATGRHAGPLAFDPDRPTPIADQWMETKFAPWALVILEGWAAGEYDALAQVMFSRADDSAQRLYYYLCELQRRGLVGGPEPLILDIAKVPRNSSIDRTEHSLRQMVARLGVSQSELIGAVEACNTERESTPVSSESGPVCLLAGTPPPDRRLHDMATGVGFAAIGPTLLETWTQLGSKVDTNSDPLAALARQVHADPAGPRSFADAGAALGDAVSAHRADAVVLWQIEEDEAQAWHLPAQRATLSAAGVPSLVMTRRDWLARDGAPEEIAAFLQGVHR